ncbi:MAG: ModD protein [Deltaproteobacteria bacterium]|jgi:molybdenum transport protein|nr:ModD protein [Deltaproteobacteria bacterium]
MLWIPDGYLEKLIEEDLHLTDLTTMTLNLGGQTGQVTAAPKTAGLVAGVEAAVRMFELAGTSAELLVPSGQNAEAKEPILRATGLASRLHSVYKAAQILMEYSSGIAGRTALLVREARRVSPDVEILVTRKHFPGSKRLSLAAALAGGASIHRTGLSDSILFFNTHLVFAGGLKGLTQQLGTIKKRFPEKKIAAEAADFQEALLLAEAGADVIQCERFDAALMEWTVTAIKSQKPQTIILATGSITADNAAALAATGVDGLVTSWPYYGKPFDISMAFQALGPKN